MNTLTTDRPTIKTAANSNQPFDLTIIDDCANNTCGNCGLCCHVLKKTVPSITGDPNSPEVVVEAGKKCPQLVGIEGRFYCALLLGRKEGDDPRPSMCKDWQGAGNRNIQLLSQAQVWIISPPSEKEIHHIEELIELNLFATVEFSLDRDEIKQVIRRYIMEIGIISPKIFNKIELGTILQDMTEKEVHMLFNELGFTPQSETHYQFIRDFVGPLGFVNPDPQDAELDSIERFLNTTTVSVNELQFYRARVLQILIAATGDSVQRAASLIERIESMCSPEELGELVYRQERSLAITGP